MMDKALLAAGCFWGVQYYFDQVPGVVSTEAGYSGGKGTNPTWHSTHGKDSDHAESLLIEFDPDVVSYETLLKHFFRLHDPTQFGGQGVNIGNNYRSAVFYYDDSQKAAAEALVSELANKYKKPIATEISQAGKFYPAEEFHQKFTQRTGMGMCHIDYKPL